MNKSTLPQGVRVLKRWYEKGVLKFDLPIQRANGQWQLAQKSLLIHSILSDYPVPPLYFNKYKGTDNENYYQALDGKQRCTSIFDFVDGEFRLHSCTPDFAIEGQKYELANKSFAELSDECKDLILGYRFTIYIVEDTTDEELEEIFARLNASTPLTLIQKARTEMGAELAGWTRKMIKFPFFEQAVSMTVAQARRESELEMLLQSMLLMEAKMAGYNYKAISMREVMKFCKEIRGKYTMQKRIATQSIIEYLSDAFEEKHKFLKKSNVPMVFMMADIAMQKDVKPKEFKKFIDIFNANISPDYEENMGSGNIKRVKTEGRLKAIYNCMAEFFNWSEKSEESTKNMSENKEKISAEVEYKRTSEQTEKKKKVKETQ